MQCFRSAIWIACSIIAWLCNTNFNQSLCIQKSIASYSLRTQQIGHALLLKGTVTLCVISWYCGVNSIIHTAIRKMGKQKSSAAGCHFWEAGAPMNLIAFVMLPCKHKCSRPRQTVGIHWTLSGAYFLTTKATVNLRDCKKALNSSNDLNYTHFDVFASNSNKQTS